MLKTLYLVSFKSFEFIITFDRGFYQSLWCSNESQKNIRSRFKELVLEKGFELPVFKATIWQRYDQKKAKLSS